MKGTMKPGHILLALATVMTWGFSYAVIAWGLQGLPPVLFAVLRFSLAAFPLVFFLPRPKVAWPWLLGHALTMFVLQFILLFMGMKSGMAAGLSSLVIQCQAFFTMGFAAHYLDEQPGRIQILGAVVALLGILLVGLHVPPGSTLLGFGLVVGAGIAWGLGNIATKRMGKVEVLSLVVWNSLLAAPVLLGAALVLEGPAVLADALLRFSWRSAVIVLFQAYPATVFCFGAWSYLMRRYPTATVAPFSLLVPVFGMISGVVFLGEALAWWKLGAAALVIGGLALNQLDGRLCPRADAFKTPSPKDSHG